MGPVGQWAQSRDERVCCEPKNLLRTSILARVRPAGVYLAQVAALSLVYWVSARLGLKMDPVSGFATLVWPSTGVALAALVLFGLPLWPGAFLGAALVNWAAGAPGAVACAIATGNTLEAVVAVWLLRSMGFRPSLERLRDVVAFIGSAAILGPSVGATVGVLSLFLGGIVQAARLPATWQAWWLGDALGALVVAPLLLAWGEPRRADGSRSPRRVEAAALGLCLVATSSFVFLGRGSNQLAPLRQAYLVYLPLMWAALRFGPRSVTSAVLVVSAIATAGTTLGTGPFVRPTLSESLTFLQAFMAIVVVAILVLKATTAERSHTLLREKEARAETGRALQHSEESLHLLETVIEAPSDAIFIKDRSGRYLMINSAGARSLGRTPAQVRGRDDTALFPPEAGQALRETDRRIMESGTAELVEERIPMPEGERVFLATKAPYRDADGRVAGLIGIARDITERKQAEEAVRESDRRKSDFLAMLSHELRNPLAPIRNSVYVLERVAPGGAQAQRARAVIGRQVEHMTHLIDDLLDVTRISRGKIRLQCEPLQLNRLLGSVAEDHRVLFHDNEIELKVIMSEQSLWVNGDPTRIAQMVGNLLQNAAKFTPRGGRAILSLALDEGGFAAIRVRDNGTGIQRETLDQLFEPFVQADRTLDRSPGGLGLGLALVKRLVELHGGTVDASSEGPGKGAEFVIRLPVEKFAPQDLPAFQENRVARAAHSPLAVESCATWQRLQASDLKAPGTAERPCVA